MTAITDRAPCATNSSAGYLAVQVSMLRRLQNSPVDLFVRYELRSPLVLYHRANCPLDPNRLAALVEGGVQNIYVQSEDFQRFGAYLLAAVESAADHGFVPPAERFAALQLAVAAEIEHA